MYISANAHMPKSCQRYSNTHHFYSKLGKFKVFLVHFGALNVRDNKTEVNYQNAPSSSHTCTIEYMNTHRCIGLTFISFKCDFQIWHLGKRELEFRLGVSDWNKGGTVLKPRRQATTLKKTPQTNLAIFMTKFEVKSGWFSTYFESS